jgi:hypothetical protein
MTDKSILTSSTVYHIMTNCTVFEFLHVTAMGARFYRDSQFGISRAVRAVTMGGLMLEQGTKVILIFYCRVCVHRHFPVFDRIFGVLLAGSDA